MADILMSGEFVMLNGEMADRDDLCINWVDFGDGYYDVHICYKKTNKLFGSIAWCGIPGLNKTKRRVSNIQEITGINDVRKEISDTEP